ncbi:creatininase family protein [Synechococcus sp. W70.1]|uniref:creatininase family protein n=1 Tax=unclassified Synechococcus TaxID=2626047 RepID=UPI0039C1B13B
MHTFIPPHRFFPYLTWTEIQAMPNKENVVIIQPVASIEQHGPHLPLVVDACIGTAIIGRAMEKLEPEIPAYVLPTQCYGKANEHWHFPGTITLSAQTLMALLTEVAESIYRAGFRKLVFLNSHGGQPEVLQIVARDLHQKYEDFLLFPISVWRVPHQGQELMTEKERELGIHAGDGETSMLMYLLPETVRTDRLVCEYPQDLPEDSLLSLEGRISFAWTTRDLSQSGVLGDATAATPEKGKLLVESMADGWVQLIRDLYKFRQPQAWRKAPLAGPDF